VITDWVPIRFLVFVRNYWAVQVILSSFLSWC